MFFLFICSWLMISGDEKKIGSYDTSLAVCICKTPSYNREVFCMSNEIMFTMAL